MLLIATMPGSQPTIYAANFADPAFQATWERTDKPVADGTVKRSFYWGPAPAVSGWCSISTKAAWR